MGNISVHPLSKCTTQSTAQKHIHNLRRQKCEGHILKMRIRMRNLIAWDQNQPIRKWECRWPPKLRQNKNIKRRKLAKMEMWKLNWENGREELIYCEGNLCEMKKERRGKWRQCEQTYELKGIGKECPPQLLIPYCERKFWQIPRRKFIKEKMGQKG